MDQVTKLRHLPYKLFVFALYAEQSVDYVRRQHNRYILETRSVCHRFEISRAVLVKAARDLEKAGYIYNLSSECGRIRFYLNLPKYLTFNQLAPDMERHVAESRVPKVGVQRDT